MSSCSRSSPKDVHEDVEVRQLKDLRRPDTASNATYRKRNLRKSCNVCQCGGCYTSLPFCVCMSQLGDWCILRNTKLTLRRSSFLYSVGIIIQASKRCKFGVRGQRDLKILNEQTHNSAKDDSRDYNNHTHHGQD
jgi:hypothetical protein